MCYYYVQYAETCWRRKTAPQELKRNTLAHNPSPITTIAVVGDAVEGLRGMSAVAQPSKGALLEAVTPLPGSQDGPGVRGGKSL